MKRKPFGMPIIYAVIIVVGSLIAAYFSLLAITHIPFKTYSEKAGIVVLICIIFAVLAVLEGIRLSCNDILQRSISKKVIKGILIAACMAIFASIVIWIFKPAWLSYGYHWYSFHTHSTITEGDDTCLSILEALEHDSDNPKYLCAAGNTYYATGNYTKAIAFYKNALENHDNEKTHFLLGKAYLRGQPQSDSSLETITHFEHNDLLESAKHLRIAVNDSPQNAEYNFQLGMACYYQYKENIANKLAYYEEALTCFDAAIQNTHSNNAEYYFWRGCLKLESDPSGAKDDFKEATEHRKFWAPYQYGLGRAYLALNEKNSLFNARECLEFAVNLDSSNEVYLEFFDYAQTCMASEGGGWGDNDGGRPDYTVDEINSGALGNLITLNSISDSKIGHEKNFVDAKIAGKPVEYWNANSIDVRDGETYTIRLYVHNNNPKGEDAIAENVKVAFSLPRPSIIKRAHTIVGYLDCSNAKPSRYWDSVTFLSDDFFYIEYIEGSASYTNEFGTVKLPDEIITSGTLLGYDKLDGKIPGCYQYDGVVTIDVKAHKAVAAKLQMVARLKGTTEWVEAVEAQIGDEIEYQIEYVNLLSETINDVMIRDVLPTNVRYVEGSTMLYNSYYPDWILLDNETVTTTGINIGSYSPKDNAYVRFTGRVIDNTLAEGTNQLVNWANVTIRPADGEVYVYKDDVSVMVNK